MKTGRWRDTGVGLALIAALAVGASAASGQVDDDDCRCVDTDGNAIENCTCFRVPEVRLPDFDRLAWPDGASGVVWNSRATRPRLGVTVSTAQDEEFDAQGARVTDVMENGPAAEAGIEEGDIITSVDGRSLFAPLPGDTEDDFDLDESIPVQRLLAVARDLEPGASVVVEYLRDGQRGSATVEVEDLAGVWGAWAQNFRAELGPQMEQLREQLREQRVEVDAARNRMRVLENFEPFVYAPGMTRYGLQLIELTPGLGTYFGTEEGVLVTDVDEDSALGLRPGDVILRVGDRDATSPERVRRIIASYGDDEEIVFRVRRQGSDIDVLGRLDD